MEFDLVGGFAGKSLVLGGLESENRTESVGESGHCVETESVSANVKGCMSVFVALGGTLSYLSRYIVSCAQGLSFGFDFCLDVLG